ncbi:cation-transporting ATPase [Isoptericola halotolerans]|uniref:cation-transporting ATPase n=1 Tax=Isoptericola halotolerans TaxID=300560 RepID=UPI00388EEE3C
MSKLSKAFSLAEKAYDAHQSSSRGSGPTTRSGSSDWRSMLESAVGGGSRPSAGPSRPAPAPSSSAGTPRTNVPDADRQAIARYDYLMRTAEPHEVEQVHAEAFERLTPQQREAVLQRMRADLPVNEQPRSASVADLSRAAGRSEARRPGSMRSVLAKAGTGGAVAGAAVGAVGLLGVVAAGAAVSSVAGPLLADAADLGVDLDSLASGIGDQVSEAGQSLSDLAGGFDVRDLF